MHEHTFITNIINQVPNSKNVKSVTIEVGELAGIEPGHLKEHLIEHTNWEVNTVLIKSDVECECGYTGPARILERLHDLVIYDCPECSEIPNVLEGNNIKVTNVIYKE